MDSTRFDKFALCLGLMLIACTWAGLAGAASGFPLSPRPRVLDARDGLPSLALHPMTVDVEGYIWIATADGLARYDGMGFRVWRFHPSEPNGLQSNGINGLANDHHGRLWVATGNGLSVLDARRKKFHTYLKSHFSEMGTDEVWNVAVSGDDVWFGTPSGLHRLKDGRIKRFVPIPGDESSLPGYKVISLAVDASAGVWVTTSGGLARWDGQRFHRYRLPGTSKNFAMGLSLSKRGLWISTTEGLLRLHSDGHWETPGFSKIFALPNLAPSVMEDGDAYWILGYKGLWHATADEKASQILFERDFESLRGSLIYQSDGGLWFSVSGLGVGYFPASWRRTSHYSQIKGVFDSDVIYDLGLASDGGVLLWGNGNKFESFSQTVKQPPWMGGIAEHLQGSRLLAFHANRQGQLWVGTNDRLLLFSEGGKVLDWTGDSLHDPAIRGAALKIISDEHGGVWIAFERSALQQRDAKGHVLRKVPLSVEANFQVNEKTIRLGPGAKLFAATSDGLAVVNGSTNRFELVEGVDRKGVVSNFDFDAAGRLWLHRIDRLEQYAADGDRWELVSTFDAAGGLPVAAANDLVTDDRGQIWWSTARGIFRWDPVTRKLRRFGRADGFSSEEVFTRLVLTADGMLVGGMADGSVIAIDTLAPDEPVTVPNLVVSEVGVRRDGGWQAQNEPSVVLRPGDRELRVQLRLLAYQDPAANRYFTRLEGYDRSWVEHQGSDRGERIFANLPAGGYTLRARAVDARGTAAREQVLKFEVLPVWWRTRWAMAGFLLLAMLAFWWTLHRYRVRLNRRASWRQAKRERELAHEASLAKTRFLATLGHEVRTPMTGVLGMSELLLGTRLDDTQRGYTEAIHGAGEHLVRLVNDALDLSRIESGKLELMAMPFDVRVVVNEVVQLMRPLAQRKPLGFEIDLDDALPGALVGDASRVRQILLNLLGNAIKFTESGRVWLQVEAGRAGIVRFEIGDTGPGLNEEQKSRLFRRFEQAEGARTAARYGGSGLGLAICQELAAVMGGAITVQSSPGKGTRFVVEVPLPASEAPVAITRPAPERLPRAAMRAVLLVEDDSIVAEVISGLLRTQGHRVTHVLHGLAALQEVAATRFDIALLDLDLPGIDGFALARQLRAQGFAAPMVALTARADSEAQAMAQDAGCDRFLRKPVTGAMLAQLFAEVDRLPADPLPA